MSFLTSFFMQSIKNDVRNPLIVAETLGLQTMRRFFIRPFANTEFYLLQNVNHTELLLADF